MNNDLCLAFELFIFRIWIWDLVLRETLRVPRSLTKAAVHKKGMSKKNVWWECEKYLLGRSARIARKFQMLILTSCEIDTARPRCERSWIVEKHLTRSRIFPVHTCAYCFPLAQQSAFDLRSDILDNATRIRCGANRSVCGVVFLGSVCYFGNQIIARINCLC